MKKTKCPAAPKKAASLNPRRDKALQKIAAKRKRAIKRETY